MSILTTPCLKGMCRGCVREEMWLWWLLGNNWKTLQWRHNGHDSVSNYQPHDCLLNSLFRRRSKKTSMLRVTGLCAGISPGAGEFPAQMTSNAENVSIWWRLMVTVSDLLYPYPVSEVLLTTYKRVDTLRPRQNGGHFPNDVSNAFS